MTTLIVILAALTVAGILAGSWTYLMRDHDTEVAGRHARSNPPRSDRASGAASSPALGAAPPAGWPRGEHPYPTAAEIRARFASPITGPIPRGLWPAWDEGEITFPYLGTRLHPPETRAERLLALIRPYLDKMPGGTG